MRTSHAATHLPKASANTTRRDLLPWIQSINPVENLIDILRSKISNARASRANFPREPQIKYGGAL